jgi:hypothetical protein
LASALQLVELTQGLARGGGIVALWRRTIF